ncbi:DUF6233 domain-containing protein [Streptomyces sp. NPDC005969]|uniref:DUF6233 domain-containing protein n=1 Tax=Streptomyces sp. NPDC005969 TaxID=3156722 RepID=UPI0033BFFE85
MSDPGAVSRLAKLRALEEWLDWQLRQTGGRIRDMEAQERQRPGKPRGEEPREQEKPQAEERRRPHTPDWGISDIGVGSPTAEVHRGDCWAAGRQLRAVSPEEAVAALADGTPACEVCRPDRVLGAQG